MDEFPPQLFCGYGPRCKNALNARKRKFPGRYESSTSSSVALSKSNSNLLSSSDSEPKETFHYRYVLSDPVTLPCSQDHVSVDTSIIFNA